MNSRSASGSGKDCYLPTLLYFAVVRRKHCDIRLPSSWFFVIITVENIASDRNQIRSEALSQCLSVKVACYESRPLSGTMSPEQIYELANCMAS